MIIRTVDIGGDKPAPHLNLPAEANPYLGYRGMRIYTEHRRAVPHATTRDSASFGIWTTAAHGSDGIHRW